MARSYTKKNQYSDKLKDNYRKIFNKFGVRFSFVSKIGGIGVYVWQKDNCWLSKTTWRTEEEARDFLFKHYLK